MVAQHHHHSLYKLIVYLYRNIIMDIKTALDNYLGKSTRFSQEDNGDGTKQVCDLDTGDCYTVRERDGLIERAGHQTTANRRVRVETSNGIKQLLNG
jgi:hypothetical protein